MLMINPIQCRFSLGEYEGDFSARTHCWSRGLLRGKKTEGPTLFMAPLTSHVSLAKRNRPRDLGLDDRIDIILAAHEQVVREIIRGRLACGAQCGPADNRVRMLQSHAGGSP